VRARRALRLAIRRGAKLRTWMRMVVNIMMMSGFSKEMATEETAATAASELARTAIEEVR